MEQRLTFPPLYRSHILHCSYAFWHQKYRPLTPKARLIPLTDAFLDYLRADGIVLPADGPERGGGSGFVSEVDVGDYDYSDGEDSSDTDPSRAWPEVHAAVQAAIDSLGGKVVPKLNWSAPKDATYMSAENDMTCRTANDVYLLLKSSDFVTHDLEHVLDGVVPGPEGGPEGEEEVKYDLVLRKKFEFNPSMEFRCFVRNRQLIGVCQRDTVYYEFLFDMRGDLRAKIVQFFKDYLQNTFPDDNYSFDVYLPPPHTRVWLIDVNPWAIRTDSLLFSWEELLGDVYDGNGPELRLLTQDDPMAYNFSSPQYSAHKMPKDVVDAAQGGTGGMGEFLASWKDIMDKNVQAESGSDSE